MCLAFLPGGKLEFNKWYVKSIPGILGIAAVVLNVVVFFCTICSGPCFRGQSFFIWAELVSSVGFWISLSLILLHLIQGSRQIIIQRVSQWPMIEAVLVGIGCFLYMTIFLDCAIQSGRGYVCYNVYQFVAGIQGKGRGVHDGGVIGVTAFFAFVAMAVYGADLFLKFREFGGVQGLKEWRNSNGNTNASSPTQQTVPVTVDVPVTTLA